MRKIPTLFVRDPEDRRYVTRQVTPGCEWVLAGEGVATRKFDGTCIRVENTAVYAFWARREVKAGKTAPDGFVPVEHDEVTGKTVGWEPWSNSAFAKYIEEARKNWAADHPLPDARLSDIPSGTYELVGPKINGNPERYDRHVLIRHASEVLKDFPRDFDGIRDWLAGDVIEGVVFWRNRHNPNAGMVKIKRRDFREFG